MGVIEPAQLKSSARMVLQKSWYARRIGLACLLFLVKPVLSNPVTLNSQGLEFVLRLSGPQLAIADTSVIVVVVLVSACTQAFP